jgi:hypothetical protein
LRSIASGGTRNPFQHSVQVREHLVVVETEHTIAIRHELLCSRLVVACLLGVVSAIELDHQLVSRTIEIQDERSNGVLATELQSTQLSAL